MAHAVLVGACMSTVRNLVFPAAPEQKRSPQELVDAFHSAFGEHHARAVHTKGIVLEGSFAPDPAAASLTRAAHLQNTGSAVTLRFSNFTGLPEIPDNAEAANPRGLSIRFTLPNGTFTDIVGHSFDGFPTATSDDFRDLLVAIGAGTLDDFLAMHPIAKTFLTTQKSPASFATIRYFGVNAFEMTNAAGASHYMRYQFSPVDGEKLLTAEQMATQSASYLQDEIKARIAAGAFAFDLHAQLAEAGDRIEDPSVAWPSSRKRIKLGTITITRLAANTPEADKALAFSPTNLVDGIETADPMLDLRGKAYPISVKERQ